MEKNSHKSRKIANIRAQGSSVGVRYVKVNLTSLDAYTLEATLIARIGRSDLPSKGPLTNRTDGGEGRRGFSKAQRKHLSKVATAKILSRTEQEKKLISAKVKAGLAAVPKEIQNLVNLSRSEKAKAFWAGLTPAQRKARRKNMSKGCLVGEGRYNRGRRDLQ